MDTIKFIIEDYVDQEHDFQFPTINIYINNKNLITLIEQVEWGYRFPLQMGETVQQSYIGISREYHRNFRENFLGEVKTPISILLTCTCREELCNSIVGKINIDSTTVTWSNIRNPFLSPSSLWVDMQDADAIQGYPIDYSSLSLFTFNKDQYMDALNRI